MRVVHIQGEELKFEHKKVDTQLERVMHRMRRMQYADYQKALKENEAKTLEIQKRSPGWVPKMATEYLNDKKARATNSGNSSN